MIFFHLPALEPKKWSKVALFKKHKREKGKKGKFSGIGFLNSVSGHLCNT